MPQQPVTKHMGKGTTTSIVYSEWSLLAITLSKDSCYYVTSGVQRVADARGTTSIWRSVPISAECPMLAGKKGHRVNCDAPPPSGRVNFYALLWWMPGANALPVRLCTPLYATLREECKEESLVVLQYSLISDSELQAKQSEGKHI